MKKYLLACLVILIALIAAGCSSFKELTGAEADAVLAYAEPRGETIITGFENDDYETFSTDMDAKLLEAMTLGQFESFDQTLEEKLGAYVSREVERVEDRKEYTAVLYRLTYEKSDEVIMTLVFTKEEPHLLSGLWVNAPELR